MIYFGDYPSSKVESHFVIMKAWIQRPCTSSLVAFAKGCKHVFEFNGSDGGIPSDENDLNNALGEANAHFSDLLEIELAALNA